MARKGIVLGAAILTAANIITRILGFIYRIYMSNLIGAEGMGLYQLIMPIYMLCWSISSSGFTTTISKLTAEEYAKKAYGNMGRVLKQSVFITTAISLVLSCGLFFFAEFVAAAIVKDIRVLYPLKVLALCFPFMSAGSCIRGYFNGMHENTVPAVSQVFEQLVRMAAIFFLSASFIPRGIEYACMAAVIGIVAGEILSFILVFLWYKSFKKKHQLNKKPIWSSSQTLGYILASAVPLAANRITGSLLSAIENVLIPQKLQLYGGGATDALAQYGMLSGMAMPLITFPSAILMAVSITLVPAVSEAVALNNRSRIAYTVAKSILFTTIVGIGASALFFIFPEEIGFAVFKQQALRPLLAGLAFICPFLYMQTTFSGILNGLGAQLFIFKINLLSSVINIFAIVVFMPQYGVNAFLTSWFVSVVISCLLCLRRICGDTKLHFDIKNWVYKPMISALAAGLVARHAATSFFFPALDYFVATLCSISLLALLYILFVLSLDAVSPEDVQSITKIVRRR